MSEHKKTILKKLPLRGRGGNFQRVQNIGWLFLIPALIFFIVFLVYPLIQALIFSFQSSSSGTLAGMEFVGGQNYVNMFADGDFWRAVGNTFIILVIQVPIMVILAMILAVALNNQRTKLKGLFRTCIFIPAITSLVSAGLLFRMMFSSAELGGLFNNWFNTNINWLTNEDPTLPRLLVILVLLWRWTGYNMIFFLSGLQNINPSIYEAAKVDGTGPVQTFFKITAPQLKPIIIFVSVTSTIGTLQLFDEVYNIFGNKLAITGTETITSYIYNYIKSTSPRYGYAAACAFVVMIMIIILTGIQFYLTRDKKTSKVRSASFTPFDYLTGRAAQWKREREAHESQEAMAASIGAAAAPAATGAGALAAPLPPVTEVTSASAETETTHTAVKTVEAAPAKEKKKTSTVANLSLKAKKALVHSKKTRQIFGDIVRYTVLTIISFICIFPFAYMILSMTQTTQNIASGNISFGSFQQLADNFQRLFSAGSGGSGFGRAFLNSLIIAVIVTILSLLISSMAGYGFEVYRSKGKELVFSGVLATMMVPFICMLVPLYSLFSQINKVPGLRDVIGLGSLGSVILPTCCTAFNVFFFRQNTKYFARELIEAGRIDGLSEGAIFGRIYMPVMKSTYAACAIITFMNSWNNFLWPSITVSGTQNLTLPVFLNNMMSVAGGRLPDYAAVFCGIFLTTLPVALIFFIMQKSFVAGMLGSVKS